MKVTFIVALLLAFSAAPPARYVFTPSSTLHVDGTSSLHDWTCEAKRMTGFFEATDTASPLATLVRGEASVGAAQLDCKNGTMNGKLKRALGADAHPTITFVLESGLPAGAATSGWTPVLVKGKLSLAGVTKPLAFTAEGRVLPTGHVHLRGAVELSMTAFGIDPPSAMLGTLKTGDDVTVRFDVTAGPVGT